MKKHYTLSNLTEETLYISLHRISMLNREFFPSLHTKYIQKSKEIFILGLLDLNIYPSTHFIWVIDSLLQVLFDVVKLRIN